MSAAIEALVVVVPAHDEEQSIVACLDSIGRAAVHPLLAGIPVLVTVVLDACDDRTGDLAAHVLSGHGHGLIVEIAARNVGRARALGMERALERVDGVAPAQVWLASTDADSRVPPDWLARHLAWARRGSDAVAGTIRVEQWDQQPAGTREAFACHQAEVGWGLGHAHVHGANLGMTAQAYGVAGGVPPLVLAEDQALWDQLQAAGLRCTSAPDMTVVTSGRRDGRATGGFSDFLRHLPADRDTGETTAAAGAADARG